MKRRIKFFTHRWLFTALFWRQEAVSIPRNEDVAISELNLAEFYRLLPRVNKGLLPDVSLPRRIDMVVPIRLLGDQPFSIRVIDTRGIADTAIRPDIRCYLDDPRTLTVLCSRFGNAPDNSLKLLMENLVSTGRGKGAGRACCASHPRADSRGHGNDGRRG